MKFLPKFLSILLPVILFSSFLFAAGPDTELRFYSTRYEIKDEKLTETDTFIIQINNRRGETYCDVVIPFSDDNPLVHFSAYIADTLGNVIRQLKKSEYSDQNQVSYSSLYQDHFVRKFTLKHNVYPYRICYSYQVIRRQFISIDSWSPVIANDVPTRKARLTVILPKTYLLHIWQENTPSPRKVQLPDYETYVWDATYDGNMRDETLSPPLSDFFPTVVLVPFRFFYGLPGSTESWEDYGEWQVHLMEGLDILPATEKKIVDDLVKDIHDKRKIIEILYHYMQDHTRYVNLTIDIGGMKPYPAEYVVANRYGDCKALTNYMKSLLSYAGIESFCTDVNAEDQPGKILTGIPSPQFNHVVLTVPLGNDTLWLENTNNAGPFGYIGTRLQNRIGLHIEKGKSRLVRVPALKPEDVLQSDKINFYFGKATEKAKVDISTVYRGAGFEMLNSLMMDYPRDIQNNYIHDHLPFQSFELQNWFLIRDGRDARSIRLKALIEADHTLKALGNDQYFSIFPLSLPEFSSPKARKLPVQISCPVAHSDTLIYHLATDYGKVELPENTKIANRFGTYEISFVNDKGAVLIYRNFILYTGIIPLSDYTELYNFISTVRQLEKRKILIYSL
jgi:hypothetical protein